MENLAKVPGFIISGNKVVDMLNAQHELDKKKMLYKTVNLAKLPDNGERIKNQIDELESILKTLSIETADENKDSTSASSENKENKSCELLHKFCSKEESNDVLNGKNSVKEESKTSEEIKPFCKLSNEKFMSFKDLTPKQTSKEFTTHDTNSPSFKNWRDQGTKVRKVLLTEAKPLVEKSMMKNTSLYSTLSYFPQTNDECAKKLHSLFVTYPDNCIEESEPENLTSFLMQHQKRGLAWLMWREQQDPSGGILADDMGLGKTLTMISLILKQKESGNFSAFKEGDFECRGTLIVCVASIIHQWEDEIKKHCEHEALKVYLYHGSQRNRNPKKMMSYDIVLTTYNIAMLEWKKMESNDFESPLFKLKWERIILDEAHTIKNHNSQTAQAVFSLRAFRKWAITGTPIHNVFKDIYSLVKFLEFSPFDDYKKFKLLTDDNSESCEQRRSLLIKSILLRRTKEEVDEWGKPLIEMKKKSFRICEVELSTDERRIYDKLEEKITKKFDQYVKLSKVMPSSSLLVLLLRLQQCCNHLSLLKSEAEETPDSLDIANILSSLSIEESTSSSSDSSESSLNLILNEIEAEELNDISVKSSKIKHLLNKLHEISESSEKKDKSVIVSQWVAMLEVVAYHLKKLNINYHMIAGSTKVEDRQRYMEEFNNNMDGPKIMLLSLKAGGVGLNLVGANHLFLLDLHWNPALEMQACDRIHRVGQKKDVTIYKFICKNTIEEKIKSLQDAKSGIANSSLNGVKRNISSLTMEDFKLLFSIRK